MIFLMAGIGNQHKHAADPLSGWAKQTKMNEMKYAYKPPTILADYREESSGIPGLLLQREVELSIMNLKKGDYVINDEIVVERKSAEDFIQSLISGRLFTQCARLRKSYVRPFLLLEGDPYHTAHKIDSRAVKGALLSIVSSWQIPVIHSENTDDTVNLLIMLGNQTLRQAHLVPYNGRKPRRIRNHRLRFLQGLPNTGPLTASRLYEHFGTIREIVNASVEDLLEVEGVGKKTAGKIHEFLSGK